MPGGGYDISLSDSKSTNLGDSGATVINNQTGDSKFLIIAASVVLLFLAVIFLKVKKRR